MQKGSTTQTTTQRSEPPAWAKPALERVGQEALRFYDEGRGYNVYTGPTVAPMSPTTLAGMNALLAATGYRGAPIENQTAQQMFPDVSAMIAELLRQKEAERNNPPPRPPRGWPFAHTGTLW
jgi:hypothetical protein